MNRNINWDSGTRNNVYRAGSESGFLTSQIWLNDLENDIQGNGVEIIELNSTDNSQSSNEDSRETQHASHPWSYAGGWKDLEENYRVNRQARLRERLRNRNRLGEDCALEFDDSFYFNNTDCPTPDTADMETFQQTCFTILDKLSALNLDSSSDFEDSSKDARCEDVLLGPRWRAGADSGEEPSSDMVSYSSDVQGEKHTIWIYSYKDRSTLSDNDYELVNIPSQESVTCSTYSSEKEECNSTKSHRVSSPIPAMHIPRLDLSLGATLPNVTEVTEPKSIDSLIKNRHVPITQKPANNWCLENSEKAPSRALNVVNWMALSPRERRRSRHNISDITIPLASVPEISQDEEKPQLHTEFGTAFTVESGNLKEEKPNRGQFEIEISDDSVISIAPSQISSRRTFIDSNREKPGNNTYLIKPSAQGRQDLEMRYRVGNKKSLTRFDAIISSFCDRGDYKEQRPHITFATPALLSSKSNPIENYHRHDWIEKQQSCRGDRRCLSAGDNSMITNLTSLKPAEWKVYSPITGSRLFIKLPGEPEFEAKKTFFQRCFSCFKCYK